MPTGLELFLIFTERVRQEGRPAGVTFIAGMMFAYALAAAVYAVGIAAGRMSLSSGAWVIGGGLEILGTGIFVLYAAMHAACAVGLWRMHRWALRATFLLLLYGLIQVTPAISSAVGDGRLLAIAREGAQILWRSAALWYLWQEPTREAFASSRARNRNSSLRSD